MFVMPSLPQNKEKLTGCSCRVIHLCFSKWSLKKKMLYAVWNKFLYVRRILTSYEKKGPFYCFQKQNKASSQPLGGKSAMYCAVYFCKAENPASCKQCRIPWSTVLYQLMLQVYTAVQIFDKGLCLSTSSWMAKKTALVAGWLGKWGWRENLSYFTDERKILTLWKSTQR